LEFPEGWGSWKKIPSVGRYVYFLELHILINENETKENKIKKENFVTQCINLYCCKIIFWSYLPQWYSMLIKVTCPMNISEFQCRHRSLLIKARTGFERAALEVSFFFFFKMNISGHRKHTFPLLIFKEVDFQLNPPRLQFVVCGNCFKVRKEK